MKSEAVREARSVLRSTTDDAVLLRGVVELLCQFIDNLPEPKKEAPVPDTRPVPRPISEDDVVHWFTYHAPTQDQLPRYTAIRDAARLFALALLKNTVPGADQTAALRKVREAVMTANASIALGGK